MKMTIGFTANKEENETKTAYTPTAPTVEEPKKSVVTVFFPQRHFSCSYYNDSFDLKKGDIVYVDGKLEGKKGYVTEVSYNFKIRLSDYKRVIAKANTDIKGRLFSAGSHFIAFDRNVLPKDTVSLWFKAPDKEEEIYEIGDDGKSFLSAHPCPSSPWSAPSYAAGHPDVKNRRLPQKKAAVLCWFRTYAVVPENASQQRCSHHLWSVQSLPTRRILWPGYNYLHHDIGSDSSDSHHRFPLPEVPVQFHTSCFY